MSNDAIFIIILVSIPIVAGTALTLISLLSMRLSSCDCPHCFRRIPKDVYKHGVPCPECSVIPEAAAQIAPTQEMHDACHACDRSTDCVRLWDGNVYCPACISQKSCRLLEASRCATLSEDLPSVSGTLAWRMSQFGIGLFSGIASVFALVTRLAEGDWQKAPACFVTFFCLGLPVILLFAWAAVLAGRLGRLKVMAWNGRLIVRFGMRLRIASLSECTWRLGRVSEMTLFKIAFLLPGDALLIDLPTRKSDDGNRVAVGHTKESREVWQAFLELADIPRTPEKRRRWSRR